MKSRETIPLKCQKFKYLCIQFLYNGKNSKRAWRSIILHLNLDAFLEIFFEALQSFKLCVTRKRKNNAKKPSSGESDHIQ
jgi:hypothetical protein